MAIVKNEEKIKTRHHGVVDVLHGNVQYFIAFGVIASLLLVAQIPIFVVLFFAIFIYFVSKMFSNSGKHRTRGIFEFYLSANQIIRNDLRRWYGFELNETIARGEQIVSSMPNAPSLVHFALGALYNKAGDHSSAVRHLSFVAENPESFESNIVYPSDELRSYVNVLRKIEREPADAPLTSEAIRSLERLRKSRTEKLLEQSRAAIESAGHSLSQANGAASASLIGSDSKGRSSVVDAWFENGSSSHEPDHRGNDATANGNDGYGNDDTTRKPITEVLHDIYDRKIH